MCAYGRSATAARRYVIVALGAISLIAVTTCIANSKLAKEHYLLYKLNSNDFNVRNSSALELAEIKSSRAVPSLLKILRRYYKNEKINVISKTSYSKTKGYSKLKYHACTPIIYALHKLDVYARPELKKELERGDLIDYQYRQLLEILLDPSVSLVLKLDG